MIAIDAMMADLMKRYHVKLTLLGKRMSNKSTGALGAKLLRILPTQYFPLISEEKAVRKAEEVVR
jgi:hypothetical protein